MTDGPDMVLIATDVTSIEARSNHEASRRSSRYARRDHRRRFPASAAGSKRPSVHQDALRLRPAVVSDLVTLVRLLAAWSRAGGHRSSPGGAQTRGAGMRSLIVSVPSCQPSG